MLTHHHKTHSSHQFSHTTTMMKIRSYDEYIRSLQEERRKIQVFHRELPLCLDLVDQAIENYKKQVCSNEVELHGHEEEGKSSNEGPVLEEFIPLKAQEEEEDDEVEKSNNNLNGKNESKVDWLKSAQLWNQKPALVSLKENHGIKETGHAFLPFQKINSPQTPPPPPPPPAAKTESTVNGGATVSSTVSPRHGREQTPTASTSSTAETNLRRSQEKERDGRKTRRCWSPELHRRFLMALQQLGGSHAATPKQIRELMKVDGLTNDEVKSHLQKYRLHTRRPSSSSAPNTGNTQAAQYVLVSGVWAPSQNYAAAAATKVVSTSPPRNRIYVPVAAPPPLSACQLLPQKPQQERKQLQLSIGSSHSEQKSGSAEHSMGGQNAHSGSPTATSSTETTTASRHS